jgi:hypothetical protein
MASRTHERVTHAQQLIGLNSPWDGIDWAQQMAPGCYSVSTPGHGGMLVLDAQNKQIPYPLRYDSFNRQGMQGWYEEDCDFAIPILRYHAEIAEHCGLTDQQHTENCYRAVKAIEHYLPETWRTVVKNESGRPWLESLIERATR